MKRISSSRPSAAAAEPGWVLSPPLAITIGMWPGHSDSATLKVRLSPPPEEPEPPEEAELPGPPDLPASPPPCAFCPPILSRRKKW